MPAKFVTGNLFNYEGLDGMAHGCNCAGAMGKGIAVEFRRRYPKMYEDYRQRCKDGRFSLGEVMPWKEGGITIFNLGTQKTWRTGAELGAIDKAVSAMIALAEESGVKRIGMPRIGAGLGGLDWQRVRALIERLGAATFVELVVFEEFKR